MMASITRLYSALNFFLNRILISKIFPKYLIFPTLSKELLIITVKLNLY